MNILSSKIGHPQYRITLANIKLNTVRAAETEDEKKKRLGKRPSAFDMIREGGRMQIQKKEQESLLASCFGLLPPTEFRDMNNIQ